MKFNGIALLALALPLGLVSMGAGKAHGAPVGLPTPALGQEHGWDAPPAELNDTQRRGFRDGIEGARKDFENHRRLTPDNRDEYRDPHLPFDLREAYQEGFRRGYAVAVTHLTQPQMRAEPAPQMQMARPAHHGWGIVLDTLTDIQRRGYQQGVEGAHRDFDSHRRPDPNNRDEYRDPPVPPGQRDEYREGFRRGYEETVSQMMGEVEHGEWNVPPDRFSEIQRRGFQEGMEGARRDFENHRRPDPDNRDEYQNPNVPPQLRDEYREGFRRGYERTIAHLTGEPERR